VKIRALITYIFLFLNFSGVTLAQEKNTVAIDSSAVSKKEFSFIISEKYIDNDFNYNETVGQSQNYLLRAINWFFQKLADIFGIDVDPGFYEIVEVLIYIILIAIALYIIIRLFVGTNAASFFTKKSKDLAPLTFEEEHIEKIDLDELIANALQQKDFRLAIRYMYLKTLKEFSVKSLIEWHHEKTNIDYYNELKSPTLQKSFKTVSYLYEHIWYGEFNLDNDAFKNAKKEFDNLNKAINSNG